jgi:membrane protease YdiL (CAAX protease family)
MQTKLFSFIEAATNTIVGLLVSFGIQLIIYPLLEIEVSIGQNVIITFVFFIASIFRGYLLRRLFNKLK